MCSCWMLQTTGFHFCKQKTIDNCTWNLSLKFLEVCIFCYLPVIGRNMIWFYAYVEHIEIKTKTVNIIHFPYLDLSQNVKICIHVNLPAGVFFSRFWGSLPSTFKIFRPWKKSSTIKSWPSFCDQYFWKFPIWNS
jgi:hypothetical protein